MNDDMPGAETREELMAAFMAANAHLQEAKANALAGGRLAEDDDFLRLMPAYERIFQDMTAAIWEAPDDQRVSRERLLHSLLEQHSETLDINYFVALERVMVAMQTNARDSE